MVLKSITFFFIPYNFTKVKKKIYGTLKYLDNILYIVIKLYFINCIDYNIKIKMYIKKYNKY